tara:strand:+ start:7837 stop:8829 length:993 start_codon:yes stop_codon:yes gene_type:complete
MKETTRAGLFNLEKYTAFIEDHLDEIIMPSKPADLYDPFRYLLSIGGKRIRPILTLLGAELFGKPKEEVVSQALSVEVFHNFTLVHDDIMDNAPLRRNKATVHEKWNTNVGVLSGDVMLIKAYQLLCKANPSELPEILELFNNTAIEVCEGQQLDMDFEVREDVTAAEYIEMIRLKTSVLLGAALNLGAIVANASKEDKKHLFSFGQNIGIAFQIQDDILDLYADPEKFGKQVGGDVISNKKTLLHLTAIVNSTKEQREILKQLQEETNIEMKITRTRQLFDQLKVKELCKERMNDFYKQAKLDLSKISVSNSNKENLLSLAKYLMERDI